MQLDFQSGKVLVKLARETVENALRKGRFELKKIENKTLQRKACIFVTVVTYPEHLLRGCIGFTSPLPLYKAVQCAAYAAAFEDPRFPPIKKEELGKVVFEVSILSEPEQMKCKPEEYAKNIEIGKDGLIIEYDTAKGLLLPQVAVEQKWSPEEFLKQVCFKAGLTPDYLYDRSTKLWKFQAQIFAEIKPNGKVSMLYQ